MTHSTDDATTRNKHLPHLSRQILGYANRGFERVDFMREVSDELITFFNCDEVEMRLRRNQNYYLSRTVKENTLSFTYEIHPCMISSLNRRISCSSDDSVEEYICGLVMSADSEVSQPPLTPNGGFFTNDINDLDAAGIRESSAQKYTSVAAIPLRSERENVGIVYLKSTRPDFFDKDKAELVEGAAQILSVALEHRTAQIALRERIKELTCLYGIAKLVAKPGISLDEILRGIVELLPPAWLYPDIAAARILFDDTSYRSAEMPEPKHVQSADIFVDGSYRGLIEVMYAEERPVLDEGAFLAEERHLIDTIAKEVALIIARRQAAEDRLRLQDQLRHADRLATIGQLAAGVAHELNEPLGNIIGFAQLAKKCPGLPEQADKDIEKTIIASMHAREIIKKLMLFARRIPPKKTLVDLNQIVEESLYFLEARCAKEGIELIRTPAPDLPEITADGSQLSQVLVNLIVNAIHAMPQGGRLTVGTRAEKEYVTLIVEDTGMGMDEDVQKKIFIPFFTTKDVDQGTGLGLPVVHGIVTSHGGTIEVMSKVDEGTRFTVKLPLLGAPDIEEK